MPDSYSLDEHFETFIQSQLATGRYRDANEVLRAALSLLERREQLLTAFHVELAESAADTSGDRDVDEVCDELEAELTAMIDR